MIYQHRFKKKKSKKKKKQQIINNVDPNRDSVDSDSNAESE